MSDYAPLFALNQRGKTMNEKTVGGEARSVIRHHFTKQMLDIWAEYEVIRYKTCCNCQNYVAWAPSRTAGWSHMYNYTFLAVWETLLCICIAVALAHHCGVTMVMMLSSCLPISHFPGHDTCQWPQWILKSTHRLNDLVIFKVAADVFIFKKLYPTFIHCYGLKFTEITLFKKRKYKLQWYYSYFRTKR